MMTAARVSISVLLLVSCAAQALAQGSDDAYSAVDPFIGTQDGGHTFPGATVPFGMIQLSPDTQTRYYKQSYPWAGGYQYRDPTILGFSYTHFSGAGHSDLGDVLTVPIAGEVRLEPGEPDKPLSGYRSRFNHDSERAEPGYYAVTLSDYGVRAELTATARVGLQRYSFPAGQPAHILAQDGTDSGGKKQRSHNEFFDTEHVPRHGAQPAGAAEVDRGGADYGAAYHVPDG